MYLKSLELSGFKSFAKKTTFTFGTPITAIVGPNGAGKSNSAEAFQFVLGEQSIKSLRGKRGEDLIFNGSKTIARQNRAAVKIALHNSKRLLNIDFDEVVIERVVHRDGVNEYLVNGSHVRLKDIIELLAQAHMGPTGHHIISQGEADRILNAGLKERRLMIEDALGLKIYQYKRHESERKLERTRENIFQVESLRRELAPHLRFLKKQVEKVEKAKELQQELVALYQEYLGRERAYLRDERAALERERTAPEAALKGLERELEGAKALLEKTRGKDAKSAEVLASESLLRELRNKKDALVRDAGRMEGELLSETRRLAKLRQAAETDEHRTIPLREAKQWAREIEEKISEASDTSDISLIQRVLLSVKTMLASFVRRFEFIQSSMSLSESETEIKRIESEKANIDAEISVLDTKTRSAEQEYERVRSDIEKEKDESREAEREIFRIMTEQNELRAALAVLKVREDKLHIEQDECDREVKEAEALVGQTALEAGAAHGIETEIVHEPRAAQHDRRRHLEKIKIRLEEVGGAEGEDMLKEYRDTNDRDSFLEREIEDLTASALTLEKLIAELTEKLDVEFKNGVHKINAQFEEFFRTMFGGGHASLSVVKEKKRRRSEADELFEATGDVPEEGEEGEEEAEEGIEINVNLPHKKIRGLEMLSGGERALTSIALLFAISQVNPPPFIVLDETDAALDEANSRKYANMIENLSKYSQLVLITHNRETMSRAGVLYGVTMGQDGISKLLSIQFEEAVKVAK